MRTIDLALKDMRQILRDKRSLVFMLVMPIVFTFFFGFVFGGQAAADPRPLIAVVNHDPDGLLSQALVKMLETSETMRPALVDPQEEAQLDSRIIKGELDAALVIPAGFSAGTLNGENPHLLSIVNEETDKGQTVRRALQTILARLMGSVETARLSAQAYEQAGQSFASQAARRSYMEDAFTRAAQAWRQPALALVTARSTAIEEARLKSDPLAANVYNQFSPGMLIQFSLFGLMQAALVMVTERKTGAMARLMTTPMRKTELIGGHILGMFVVFFIQQAILVTFGQLFLKVDYLRQPVALLVVMVAFSLWVAALGLLISTLAKKEDQVVLMSMAAMFLFSALGGAWFSLEMVGKAFAAIGHFTPTAWAIDGFQNLVVRGLGVESVLLPAGIILAYAAAFFAIAVWKFKFE